MTVVTSPQNRAYQFVLTAHESQGGASPRPNDMYFKVAFRYPEEERAKAERERQIAETNRLLEEGHPAVHNYEYWGCGSDGLMPDAAYDDGRFTYLQFSANRDMPAVFEELPGGQEALINTHVEGDTIVVHRVVHKLVLRKGGQVTCIQNRAFNPRGISTPSGTVNPAVNVEVASAALSHLEDDRYTTEEIQLRAPASVGEQVWQLHLLHEEDGSPCEGIPNSFSGTAMWTHHTGCASKVRGLPRNYLA